MCLDLVRATEKDKQYLLQLRKDTMTPHLENEGLFYTDDKHWERICDAYDCAYLIFKEGSCVGAVKFALKAEELTLMQLQIEQKHQGQGIGRQIITKLFGMAGPRPIRLTVLKSNPAKRLYLALGFRVYNEDNYECYMQATPLNDEGILPSMQRL